MDIIKKIAFYLALYSMEILLTYCTYYADPKPSPNPATSQLKNRESLFTEVTAPQCNWQQAQSKEELRSISCRISTWRSELIKAFAVFPDGKHGELTLNLTDRSKQSDGSIIGVAIYNDKKGNYHLDASNKYIEVNLEDGQRIELKRP